MRKPRTRNHRKDNCSSCEKISIAKYVAMQDVSSIEKIEFAQRNSFVTAMDNEVYQDRILLFMYDGSILAVFVDGKVSVVDSMGRIMSR